ncbi:hypothetical protein As57867_003369, partial [Aphanomyces stellatus]
HRVELVAAVHCRKTTLFRALVAWTAWTKCARAQKEAAGHASTRRRRADTLLTLVLAPTHRPGVNTTSRGTSPSLPPDHETRRLRRRPWRTSGVAPPSPPPNAVHVGTSPPKKSTKKVIVMRVPATTVVPAAIADMHVRQDERRKRWEALQAKYEAARAAREETERQVAAEAEAAVERQKDAARAKKNEAKREAARAAAERERRRQLAIEQWALAKQHATRASVRHRGFYPWRALVAHRRVLLQKAQNWHADAVVQAAWTRWRQFLARRRVVEQERLQARLTIVAQWHVAHVARRCLRQWRGHYERLRGKATAVAALVWRRLGKRVLHVGREVAAARRAQLMDAQHVLARRTMAHGFSMWTTRVKTWRAARVAAAEKAALWSKVKGWLNED